MASIFSHPAVPLAIGLGLGRRIIPRHLLIWGCIACIVPDLDVIAFSFGIPYSSDFGHRGFTHSIVFAAAVGLLGALFHRQLLCSALLVFIFLFSATISHGMLDALTNGGLGIAFFWPFSGERYFFPWQPIQVSPIGISFFSNRGLAVIRSELIWIWLPCALSSMLLYLLRSKVSRLRR
jgi:inner membrane protein